MIDIAQLESEISQFIISAGWAKEFTNGSDTHTFNTDSGPKISFAKAIKDFQDDAETRLTTKELEFLNSLASKELAWDQSLTTKEGEWDNSTILANVTNLTTQAETAKDNAEIAKTGAQNAQSSAEAARDQAEVFKNQAEQTDIATEEAARIAGDKFNGVSLGNNAINANNVPNTFTVAEVSRSFIFGSQASALGFPAGGEVEVDLRYSGTTNYNLAKMAFRSYNGAHNLVRYSANAGGTAWTPWEQNLTITEDGKATVKELTVTDSLKVNLVDESDADSVYNRVKNDELYLLKNEPIRHHDLSLLTDRSIGNGSVISPSQSGLRLLAGSTAGDMAMVTLNQIVWHGGQNGGSRLNPQAFPETIYFGFNFQPRNGARQRILIGQSIGNIATPLPDDGTQAGVIVEIDSDGTGGTTRIRLGVAKTVSGSGAMNWSAWIETGKSYKAQPLSYALTLDTKARLVVNSHHSSHAGYVINHPDLLPDASEPLLAGSTANIQITLEFNGATATNVENYLEYFQSRKHAT